MKAYVNPDFCSGTGLCINTCPEVFELNEEQTSTVKTPEIPPGLEDACRQAALNCPTNAISIED